MRPDRKPRAELLEQALLSPDRAQAELLARVLRENASTRFGAQHAFARLKDLDAYRREVPVAGYESFREDVDAMLEGAQGLLVPGRPVFFARTSGTSGKAKHIPYPAGVEREYRAVLDPSLVALEADHPGSTDCALTVTGTYCEAVAPCGVPIGSASGFVRNLSAHRDEPFFKLVPEVVWELTDFEARYYAVLRLALPEPLVLINALNPSSILTLFSKVEQFGPALIQDLRRGAIDAGPPAARALARLLADRLRPEPAAAERLAASLAANGRFFPGEMWPSLRVLQTWKGGSAAHYLASLRERCPGAVVRPAVSGSSEGLLMAPLRGDAWFGGVPALNSSVLEFFPEESAPEPSAFVPISALAEGRGYRVVLTNGRGMYRYLMDDVFVVEGKVEQTPIMRFSHRYGLTSSLTGEKLTEPQVAEAMAAATAELEVALTDYQLGPEWAQPPRYLLLVELRAPSPAAVLEKLLARFEAALARANVEYEAKRTSGRLAPPLLVVLERGEFERQARLRAQERGGSDAQVKVPRLRRDLVDRAALRSVDWAGGQSSP